MLFINRMFLFAETAFFSMAQRTEVFEMVIREFLSVEVSRVLSPPIVSGSACLVYVSIFIATGTFFPYSSLLFAWNCAGRAFCKEFIIWVNVKLHFP